MTWRWQMHPSEFTPDVEGYKRRNEALAEALADLEEAIEPHLGDDLEGIDEWWAEVLDGEEVTITLDVTEYMVIMGEMEEGINRPMQMDTAILHIHCLLKLMDEHAEILEDKMAEWGESQRVDDRGVY